MLRPDDRSALNRIVMHVIQFLDHHFIIQNRLGMKSFLPDLVFAPRFVPCAIKTELIQQPEALFAPDLFQNHFRSENLEVGNHPG